VITVSAGSRNGRRAASRTTAVTVCPRCRPCSTSCLPRPPVAPNTVIFIRHSQLVRLRAVGTAY
jgi:hypothetical protein